MLTIKGVSCALLSIGLVYINACQPANSEQTPDATTAPSALSPAEQPSIGPVVAVAEDESPETITEDNRTGNVQYHNPNTGTNAEYDLEVDYDGSGDVDRITFPSGGYISDHHIADQTHNGDGTITVTTDRGQEFTVDEEDGHESDEQ